MREALEFYANGGHEVELHGKIDWVAERDRLHDRGFHHVCEAYSGSETFVECGQKAQAALALMDTQPAAGAVVLDALEAGKHYAEEALERHDQEYQRHPATEPERSAILADIGAIDAAIAASGRKS